MKSFPALSHLTRVGILAATSSEGSSPCLWAPTAQGRPPHSQAQTPLGTAPLSERRQQKKQNVWGGREAPGAGLASGDLQEPGLVSADRQLLHQLLLPCRFPWQTAPVPQSPTRQRCFEPLTVRTTPPRLTAVGQTSDWSDFLLIFPEPRRYREVGTDGRLPSLHLDPRHTGFLLRGLSLFGGYGYC